MSTTPRSVVRIGVALAAVVAAASVTFATGVVAGAAGSNGGPPTSEAANNLSNPAVFAEGVGITGLSDTTSDPSLAPYQQTWTGLRVPSPDNPTLGTGTGDTYTDSSGTVYYLQATDGSSWQASWQDAKGSPPVQTNVKWGDNLVGTLVPSSGQGHSWSTSSTIHVEVSMTDTSPMGGDGVYFPTPSLYGSGESETFGTTGVATPAGDQHPNVYSDAAYLTIQQIDAAGNPVGSPVHTLATWNRASEGPGSDALTAEVNAGGGIVYGYNWFAGNDNLAPGTYRLTFGIVSSAGDPSLDPPTLGNATIAGVVAPSGTEGTAGAPVACGTPIEVSGTTIPLTCGVNGTGTFSSIDITLAAGDNGGGGGGGGTGGGPHHLGVSSGTVSTTAGDEAAQPIQVSVLDAEGQVVGTDDTTEIDLGLASPPAGVRLTCTEPSSLRATASGGIATFNGCAINVPGTYTLVASVPATSPAQPSSSTVALITWVVGPGPQGTWPAPPGWAGTPVVPSTGGTGSGSAGSGSAGTGSAGSGSGAGSAGQAAGTGPLATSHGTAAALMSRRRALAQLNKAITTTNASIHKYHVASLRALRQHLAIQPKLAANVRQLELRLRSLLERRRVLVALLVRLRG